MEEENKKPLNATEINKMFFRERKKRSSKEKKLRRELTEGNGRLSEGLGNDGSEYSDEDRTFMMAIDAEKRRLQKPVLEWAEVLRVALRLGYRKPIQRS